MLQTIGYDLSVVGVATNVVMKLGNWCNSNAAPATVNTELAASCHWETGKASAGVDVKSGDRPTACTVFFGEERHAASSQICLVSVCLCFRVRT